MKSQFHSASNRHTGFEQSKSAVLKTSERSWPPGDVKVLEVDCSVLVEAFMTLMS